ncbi:hypothetical protein IE077_003148 [Cardiosporidium cionae]|uniref:Tryptophan synthase beta chain-like PALP domain-containing protein n=1 Tax=Cardiosporidium cionae TaxID=476202 RepID=A0ABQ7JFF2_9APIC|nr:hypothetical protein IE077_003148 [Cardiosporidium cionae]|eukprot:KAF8822679.1 hypothetical protein IE077_003148 [Cardiosporidium cionae]
MPRSAPKIKVDNVTRLGAEVVLVGDSFDECMEACNICVNEEKKLLIHPFDDPYVIAGQATIGLEMAEQTELRGIDYIFSCCGGGGLISGVGTVFKSISPHTKIVGVEADEAAGMTESLKQGKVVSLSTVGKFADGAAVKTVGEYTFKICNVIA